MSKVTKANQGILQDHLIRNEKVYSPGVLNPKQHFTLVEELARYSKLAGISEHFVYNSMSNFCDDPETDWMRHYLRHLKNNTYGAVFVNDPKVLSKMSSMVGCALRNYIRGRLMTLQGLVAELKDGGVLEDDLLAISNFCLPKNQGGDLPSWQLPLLIGVLYERFAHKRLTVISTSSMLDLKGLYGEVIYNHVMTYFTVFK